MNEFIKLIKKRKEKDYPMEEDKASFVISGMVVHEGTFSYYLITLLLLINLIEKCFMT